MRHSTAGERLRASCTSSLQPALRCPAIAADSAALHTQRQATASDAFLVRRELI
jgi:hypothetical protein